MKHFIFIQMKTKYASAALLWSLAMGAMAVNDGQTPDSLRVEELSEVVVKAVKAPSNAPFAVANIGRKELETFGRTGQELPFLFARTPGILAWSENGVGTGTTSMRVRGAGATRMNITLDGVSLNSPEDQCVFWANMNSYATLLGNVQIQRGVGTSTNGDGAFGGTVALTTKAPSLTPMLEVSGAYGSYNTYNVGGNFSTGLLLNHLIFEGAYHHTGTDGFIHGTAGNSGSYYGGLTWLNNDGTLKLSYKNIGNYETTGQAWSGVTAGNGDYSLNSYTGIKTYRDMYKAGLGKFNSLYENFVPDWNGGWTVERYKMADGSLWDQTTDNFWQNHNLLNVVYQPSEHWTTTATMHYTHGHGYYDEFRYQNKPKKFGISDFYHADGSKLKKTDFVRQKGLTQDTYGITWNANYKDEHWDVIGGASFQNFEGNHFGYLTYVADEELRQQVLANGKYTYYDSNADKSDQSIFIKGSYHITPNWDAFADVQYRHVGFLTQGINDRFYDNGDGTYSNQRLDVHRKYDFVNPKAGLSWHANGHNAYASYALSHREPERNNFTDNGSYPAPKAESVHDVEFGYNYTGKVWYAGVNFYAMLYHNQFVQTGQQSDIGENLTTNVKESQRIGAEITAGVNVTKWLSLEANAALSQNKIKDFDEYIETYNNMTDWVPMDPTVKHYDNSTLAFSPAAIVNGFADFHIKGFQATWHTGFVSRQYMDNSECKDRSLPKYSRTDIHLSYDLRCGDKGLKHVLFGLDFGNIFNRRYASSGWAYSSILGADKPETDRYYQLGYIPSAGFTAMGSVKFRF